MGGPFESQSLQSVQDRDFENLGKVIAAWEDRSLLLPEHCQGCVLTHLSCAFQEGGLPWDFSGLFLSYAGNASVDQLSNLFA